MTKHILIFILSLLVYLPLSAQVSNTASTKSEGSIMLQQAQTAYHKGDFSEALDILNRVKHSDNRSLAADAYHLMAQCHIEMGDKKQAEQDIHNMLQKNPYYTVSTTENPILADFVNEHRIKSATIVTASQQAESIDESPVPVTLITREMIELSGANTLQDLLLQYVPGITKIEGPDANIAMRGTFSHSQECMLILLDGHRLNSYSSNVEVPDYRTSLDKIDHIEVLRGPASSLYGNVALTGVVNIITRKGNGIDGFHASAQYGSNNSLGINLLRGKGGFRSDHLAWASIYRSDGESVINPNMDKKKTTLINGYKDLPAFDAGTRIRWDELTLAGCIQHSKRIPYECFFQLYDYTYDKYDYEYSTKPGTSRTSINIMADYNHTWNNLTLSVALQGNYERSTLHTVMADSLITGLTNYILGVFDFPSMPTASQFGIWQAISWQGFSFNSIVSCAYSYTLGRQKGSIISGVQYDLFVPTQSYLFLGYDYDKIQYTTNNVITKGNEYTSSAFLQLKHRFSDKFIFNGGLRCDYKHRYDKEHVSMLSPRISLIWLLNKNISLRASYAQSYVDAPYIYRACTLKILSSDLKPQKMATTQIGFTANWPAANLKWELNSFYNDNKDLVLFGGKFEMGAKEMGFEKGVMSNECKSRIGGIESIITYQRPSTLATLNFTYQHAFDYQEYDSIAYDFIPNVPEFVANLTVAQKIVKTGKWGELWFKSNIYAQSDVYNNQFGFFSKTLLHSIDGESFMYDKQYFKCIANAGMEWRIRKLRLGVDVYNIFNTHYDVGSRINSTQPQQSRHFLAKASFDF